MKASRVEGLPLWFGRVVSHTRRGEQQEEPLPRSAFHGVGVSQERRRSHQPLHLTSCRFYSQLVVLRDASLIEIQETLWRRSTKCLTTSGARRECCTCVLYYGNDPPPTVLSCACNQESNILGLA